MPTYPIRFERWQDSVEVSTASPAIQWKAEQPKDRNNIRSRHSEDALTWKVFRTIDLEGRVQDFLSNVLGVDDVEPRVLYWQRLALDSEIHPVVHDALRRFEPYHAEVGGRQHTETDLMIAGERHLLMFENKLGWPNDDATGWRRSGGASALRSEYREHIELLLRSPADWPEVFIRYWQLLRNLALGRVLASGGWPGRQVHLVALWNGDAYRAEFDSFRRDVVLPAGCAVHGLSWHDIASWARSVACDFVAGRLTNHPCLQPARRNAR